MSKPSGTVERVTCDHFTPGAAVPYLCQLCGYPRHIHVSALTMVGKGDRPCHRFERVPMPPH